MKKILQISDGKVIDILNGRDDVTADSLVVVDEIPACTPEEGYNGVLEYSVEKGLYWGYVEAPVEPETADVM